MRHGTVLLDVEGPLARVTLNRPEVLNAANLAFMEDFEAVVDALEAASEVKVVLVRGAGRAFSAGVDLDMTGGGKSPELLGFFGRQERSRCRLEALDKITIAAVHGYCVGGGLQLAIACDIRVCSSDCKLGLPAVLEGIIPGLAPVRLPRLIGLGPTRRLVLSGELVDAEESLRLGMVDYVVPAERFEEETAAIVERYLKVPHTGAVASKQLMRRSFEEPLSALEAEMVPMIAACLDSPEAAEAARAWKARREERGRAQDGPPSWRRWLQLSRSSSYAHGACSLIEEQLPCPISRSERSDAPAWKSPRWGTVRWSCAARPGAARSATSRPSAS